MECSLEDASREFEEIIENRRDNLKFLQQLNATYSAIQDNLWDKATMLVVDILDDQAGEKLQEAFGEGLSFDTLKLAVQMTALIKPEAFAKALSEQVDTLREFFEEEKERVEDLLERLTFAIDKLNSDWQNLIDADFEEAHLKELNDLMNKRVPDAGTIINAIRKDMLRLENDVYNKNITEELTRQRVNEYMSALQVAKDKLEDDTTDNIVSNLISLLQVWQDIRRSVIELTSPTSEEFMSIEDMFKTIGENFRSSMEDMMATLQTIREILMELDTTDDMMFSEWNQTIAHVVKNNTDYNIAPEIRKSIDDFLDTGTPENIASSFPVVSGIINSDTLNRWEGEANLTSLNKSTWISQIDYILELFEGLLYERSSDVILNYDNIYEPLTDDVIDAYKEAAAPVWRVLLKQVNESHRIIYRMRDGVKATKNIRFVLEDIRNTVNSFNSIIDSQLQYFAENSPKEVLETSLGLTRQTKGAIEGMVVLSDYLGLDKMSDLINTGNFGEAVGLSQADADSVNELLNDLRCLNEANDIAKSAAIEIRKIVRSQKQRKDRLMEDSSKLIERGIDNQEKEIEDLQELSETLKSNL